MDEGYFRQIRKPRQIINANGSPKKDVDGSEWFEVEIEELGILLRNIK